MMRPEGHIPGALTNVRSRLNGEILLAYCYLSWIVDGFTAMNLGKGMGNDEWCHVSGTF